MELAVSGVPLPFEVTFASGLFVAMTVVDITASPVIVQGPTAMVNVIANTYVGFFTAVNLKKYLILKAVYTDGTFSTLDSGYSQGSETIEVKDPSSGGGSSSDGCQLIGVVVKTPVLIGLVEC